jgi:protein TonB
LRDRGTSGLSGTSGGFAGIGDVGGSSSGGGSNLSGAVSGTGRGVGGGSGRSPYEISGALANRRILNAVLPVYPDWARDQGLIASVSLKFFVLHTGAVKANITVQRSSGYGKLDAAAIDALRQWRFEPLSEAQYGQEQWGFILFKFRAL